MTTDLTPLLLFETWDERARYSAVADVDIEIANIDDKTRQTLRWTITQGDGLPEEAVRLGTPLRHGETKAMQLDVGDRLWLVGETGGEEATVRERVRQ